MNISLIVRMKLINSPRKLTAQYFLNDWSHLTDISERLSGSGSKPTQLSKVAIRATGNWPPPVSGAGITGPLVEFLLPLIVNLLHSISWLPKTVNAKMATCMSANKYGLA